MFFNSFVLTKRGPLAKVWLAAHWDKKLSKQEIQLIDLTEVVVDIMRPEIAISCRTNGELLLGCVKVFHNKVGMLLKDAQDIRLRELKPAGALKTKADVVPELDQAVVKPVDEDMMLQPIEAPVVDSRAVDTDDIGALLQRESKKSTSVTAAIGDDWLQVGESQAVGGLQESPAVNLTQDALRELAGKEGSEARSSTGRDARLQAGPPDILIGPPMTDEMDDELRNMINAHGGVPMEDELLEQGRPSDPPLPPAEDPLSLPEEPEKKRRKTMRTVDTKNQIDMDTIHRNMNSGDETSKSAANYHRFTISDLGPAARREQVRTVAETIKESILTLRGTALQCGDGLPMVLLGEINLGGAGENVDIVKECVGKLLAAAVQEEPLAEVEHPEDDPFVAPPEMREDAPSDFAPLPDHIEMAPAPSMQHHSTGIDPVESAQRTLDRLRGLMKSGKIKITFQVLASNLSKRDAAQRFMDLLVLGSKGHIGLHQEKPFGTISVSKAEQFNSIVAQDPSLQGSFSQSMDTE